MKIVHRPLLKLAFMDLKGPVSVSLRSRICGIFMHASDASVAVAVDGVTYRLSKEEMILIPGNRTVQFSRGSYGWNGVVLSGEKRMSKTVGRDYKQVLVEYIKRKLVLPIPIEIASQDHLIPMRKLSDLAHSFSPMYTEARLITLILGALQSPHMAPPERTPRPSPSHGHAIRLVQDYLRTNFRQPLTLDQVAWYIRVSREHLTRIFKQHEGITVFDALREIRIREAKILLRETEENLEVISERSGFTSSSLFCRTFKENVRCTPSEFRAQSRRSHPRRQERR